MNVPTRGTLAKDNVEEGVEVHHDLDANIWNVGH